MDRPKLTTSSVVRREDGVIDAEVKLISQKKEMIEDGSYSHSAKMSGNPAVRLLLTFTTIVVHCSISKMALPVKRKFVYFVLSKSRYRVM